MIDLEDLILKRFRTDTNSVRLFEYPKKKKKEKEITYLTIEFEVFTKLFKIKIF